MITSSPNNCTVLMRPKIVHYSKKALLSAARKAAFLPPQYTKKKAKQEEQSNEFQVNGIKIKTK